MSFSKETLESLSQFAALMPQEQMVKRKKDEGSLFIGIPKETSFQEHRVALAPKAVELLVTNGHRVIIENGAGVASNFADNLYSEAGAQIVYDTKEVYQADLILKVAPPSLQEIEMMKERLTLVSALQLTVQPKDFIRKLIDKKITAIAWDYIRDSVGIFPVVRAMGEIAGNTAILLAAEFLSSTKGQRAMLGGISGVSPTEVVIIGAGTVGEFATRAALGLGASVKIFDNSTYKLRRLQNDIGTRLFTSTIQPDVLRKALSMADVAIGAIRAPFGRTPCIVNEEMVSHMKAGAVIVDVSIDQGGCFDTTEVTTHDNPVVTKYGVIHYGVPNIPSRVSRTASYALSNIFAPILLNIGDNGGVENVIRKDIGVRHSVYLYKGTLTNEYLAKTYNLPFKDLDLLMAAF
jgi:alanine dehydrogenase